MITPAELEKHNLELLLDHLRAANWIGALQEVEHMKWIEWAHALTDADQAFISCIRAEFARRARAWEAK